MSLPAPVNILIVDDSRDKLVALEVVLEGMNLNLICVQSGREALRCILQQEFAAILLDVNMPIMDGFETAELIRRRKQSESTPIIFITSHGDDQFVARGYELGAVDYLLTPIVPAVLRTKVAVFAEVHRQSQQLRQQAVKLQQRAEQLAALAAELSDVEQRERRRLAQILHDNLQQLLVAARFRIGAFRSVPPAQQIAIVDEVDTLLHQAIGASRSLTAELSPPILYDAGLVPALEWLARRMNKNHGMTVELHAMAKIDFAADNLRSFVFNAVRELLFNCLKHSGVDVARVSVSRNSEGNVQVAVSDSGAGFDPASLELSVGDRDSFGLFSIRERVALMKGHVDITSKVGGGTTIVLTMPDHVDVPQGPPSVGAGTDSGDINPHGNRNGGSARTASKGTSIRVLVADDHETIRKGLVTYLEKYSDIEVVGEASDGRIAVELSRTMQPDVILMDVTMPVMNGVEATRLIKQHNAGVRVIGLSMHKREDMAAAMTLAGASLYLPKDSPPQALVDAIREGMGLFTAQSLP